MLKTTGWLAAVSLAVNCLDDVAATAQEQKLKVSQVFPSTHWHWTEGMRIFTEAATEASGGKIKFEVYHAGQLGKD